MSAAPKKVGNLTVFHSKGSAYEIGFQHGQAFGPQIRQGLIPYIAQFLNRTMARSDAPILEKPVLAYLKFRYVNKMLRNIPARHRDLLRGLTEGAGLDPAVVNEAVVFPDLFLGFIAMVEKLQFKKPVARVALGCSSAIATKSATQDGKLYHARNFDYPAVGHWDQNRVIGFCEPDDGMPFMEVQSMGAPISGITGLNAAGISVCMHQHWVDRLDSNGVLAGVAGDELLRKATTLDEAIAIVLKFPPVGGWTYMISDGNRKEAVALEVAPGGHGIVRMGETGTPDTLGYSNVYLSQELGGREYALSEHYWKNCLWRLSRVRELLKQDYGRHTPQTVGAILGDSCSPDSKGSCLLGTTIVSPITVTSVVLDPEARVFWVADGAAPSSHREFVPFGLKEGGLVVSLPRFSGTRGFGSDAADFAMSEYLAGFQKFFESGDVKAAFAHMKVATERYGDAPELWLVRSVMALRAENAEDALHSAKTAISRGLTEPALSDAKLVIAFAQELKGGESKAIYKEVAVNPEATGKARQLAKRGAFQRFTPKRARSLAVDFVHGGLG